MTKPKDAENAHVDAVAAIPSQVAEHYAAASDVQITVPNIGVGAMRTTATHVAVLLQLDGNDKAGILVSAAKALGMTLDEIADAWNDKPCDQCGMSLRSHDTAGCP